MKVNVNKDGKKKTYKIIQSWNDVSLEKWQQIMLGKKGSKTEEATATIQALSTLPKKLIKEMALSDVSRILTKMSELQIEGKHKMTFELEGQEYGFHPDLDEITLGEYADIEAYMEGSLEKNLHKIMAVLFRPIVSREGKLYSIEAYKDVRERAEKFKTKMTALQVQEALVFFWDLGKKFAKILPSYFLEMMDELKEKQLQEINLRKNGVGLE